MLPTGDTRVTHRAHTPLQTSPWRCLAGFFGNGSCLHPFPCLHHPSAAFTSMPASSTTCQEKSWNNPGISPVPTGLGFLLIVSAIPTVPVSHQPVLPIGAVPRLPVLGSALAGRGPPGSGRRCSEEPTQLGRVTPALPEAGGAPDVWGFMGLCSLAPGLSGSAGASPVWNKSGSPRVLCCVSGGGTEQVLPPLLLSRCRNLPARLREGAQRLRGACWEEDSAGGG